MQREKIARLLKATAPHDRVLVKGWVRTKRDAQRVLFHRIERWLMPGQPPDHCRGGNAAQLRRGTQNYDRSGPECRGAPGAFPRQGPAVGGSSHSRCGSSDRLPKTTPLQKKRHTDEYLRSIAHLRPRTNKYGAAFRIRSELAFAIHHFFHERDFRYIHTPILTASDCEGAGEMFRVTTLPTGKGQMDEDFFGTEANLTVSGQLEAEMLALSLGDVYTFGPTFRAENSNTPPPRCGVLDGRTRNGLLRSRTEHGRG